MNTPEKTKKIKKYDKSYEAFGESRTITEWANVYGIVYATLYSRVVKRGMPLEEALNKPSRIYVR
jgi:hypothetical protein